MFLYALTLISKIILLQVGTVTPNLVFPSSTWIIGNHSDELTPWIPVIALKSSPKTNYFVLPCCSYDFSGQKYSRRDTSISQYSDYLNYIKEISNICGFTTDTDRLRIPSTKRLCLVGIRTDHQSKKPSRYFAEIEKFIGNRAGEFQPRNTEEKARNCTQLDKKLIERIVFVCVRVILNQARWIKKADGKYWNCGSPVILSELTRDINPEDLKALKNECGGLQTLLKNHRYLFRVVGGCVSLKQGLKLTEETEKYRTKTCWFNKHHPNGCFYSAEQCAYLH